MRSTFEKTAVCEHRNVELFRQKSLLEVTLPEWLTGSPAINNSCQRLGFARECSNRSGDDIFVSTLYQLLSSEN